MKDFEFYKTIRLSKSKKVVAAFSKLHNIYNTIPDTKGCMENINTEGAGCKAWCCRIQTPQLLYSEFLLIWNYISKNWDDNKVCELLEKCMLNTVNTLPSKGCVFFDEDLCMCRIHEKRPYNCRIYGITPKEEFEPRYLRLKEEYKSIVGAVIKPQCELVSTCGEKKVATKDTDKWWNKVVKVDRFIGIPKDMISDEMGGSYRSPHDHILLYNMPINVLNSLAGIRKYDDEFKKKETIKELIQVIQNAFKNTKNKS